MKNRRIQVSLVPETEPTPPAAAAQVFESKADVVERVLKDIAKYAAAGVCGFVILDTARQVLITKASTPQL